MADPYLKGNKSENRPHYYCLEDMSYDVYWMIPLSSRVEKYQKIIDKRQQAGKNCDILYIAELDNHKENVFLIQDIFPITEEYIEREYMIGENQLILTSEHIAKEIEKRARKVIGLLKRGIKFMPTQPDIFAILDKLKK